jgi:hypothetical protein
VPETVSADYEDTPENRQRLYEQTKAELASQQLANATTFDNSILTLSSAFLGLSVAFIKDVVSPISSAVWLPLLYLSWGSFCAAIVTVVGSFIIGQHAYTALRRSAERYYIKGEKEAFNISVTMSRRISVANIAHGTFFMLGTIFTLAFVLANFSRLAAMPINTNAASSPLEKGQPTNPFQAVPQPAAGSGSAPQPGPAPAPAPVAPSSQPGT